MKIEELAAIMLEGLYKKRTKTGENDLREIAEQGGVPDGSDLACAAESLKGLGYLDSDG